MTWLVRWNRTAHIEVDRLVQSDQTPPRIQTASDWIDYALRRMPYDVGESRESEQQRIWYGDVLGVYYEIDEPSQSVVVYSVGLSRRGSR